MGGEIIATVEDDEQSVQGCAFVCLVFCAVDGPLAVGDIIGAISGALLDP